MYDATRLAAKGLFRCRRCRQVGPQDDGIVVAFAGNVLLAIHPECMTGPIKIERNDTQITVEFPTPRESSILLLGDIADSDVRVARPQVEKVKL